MLNAMYEITIAGELNDCWSRILGPLAYMHTVEGRTVFLLGPVDQSELIRMLAVLEEANLPILTVTRLANPFIQEEGGFKK